MVINVQVDDAFPAKPVFCKIAICMAFMNRLGVQSALQCCSQRNCNML